ncbi:MAG: LCP family protein [Eubacteriales bacterium]|nr:LCP family protein [Eubacteriales bacterium]
MSRHQDDYQNRNNSSMRRFYDENCDEAWEQIKDLFGSRAAKRTAKIVGLLIALVLVAAAVLNSFFIKPELPDWGKRHNGGTEDGVDYGDGIQPAVSGERKSKDYYTVLVLGRDTGGGGNTDTMLLASYDVTNQKATVMSIPRDTMVNVPWDIKRINSVYNYNGQGSKGIAALYKEISQLVGFEPDYQVIVEWDAVGEIVEAMGGIYFEVPRNMNYDDPYQDLHIHQEKGYRLLSGSDVMQVLRYRHDNDMRYGYADGDLGRIKTQQALLKAMITQLLQIKNVTKIGDFAKAVKNNVESDLSFNEMLWFGKQAVMGGLSVDNVNFLTMPNTATYAYSRSTGSYQSYVVPNANELLSVVNHELSPFKQVFTLRDLDIMSVNADGSLSSSTGYVEDQKAAVPPAVKHENPNDEDQFFDEDGNPIVGGDEATDNPTLPDTANDPDAETSTGDEANVPIIENPMESDDGEYKIPDWLTNME